MEHRVQSHQYTCPMDSEVLKDVPGNCQIRILPSSKKKAPPIGLFNPTVSPTLKGINWLIFYR